MIRKGLHILFCYGCDVAVNELFLVDNQWLRLSSTDGLLLLPRSLGLAHQSLSGFGENQP